MAKCGIYKITNNINGHAYIGQSIDIDERWASHLKRKPNATMTEPFEKYGIENFSFEILEECQEKELYEREKYWIAFYDTYYNGYNKTKGGENCQQRNPNKKAVVQYDLEGNFITLYESISAAERALNIKTRSSNITRVCQGKACETNGYQWRYLEDCLDTYKENIGSSQRVEKIREGSFHAKNQTTYYKVAQCDKETHSIIKIFDSVKEAAKCFNIHETGIRAVCRGKQKTAAGYYWMKI